MEWQLDAEEVRVLGSLMEKEATTPDYYPLSLNALVNACNQKNNRDPVMTLEENAVRDALSTLQEKRMAGPASLAKDLTAGLDIRRDRARKRTDHWALNLLRDQANGFGIFWRGRGVTSLDHIDAQLRQLPGNHELLAAAQTGTGGLLSISESRVKNSYLVGHGSFVVMTL